MPFPPCSFTYAGGCNCRAIRYRTTIPNISSRPPNIYGASAPPAKLPMVAICHCNDCRRAHSQALGFAIINDLTWVELSLLSQSAPAAHSNEAGALAAEKETRDAADAQRPEWIAAATLLHPRDGPQEGHQAIADSWLRFYRASEGRARGFCGRCGTPLMYFAFAEEEKLPEGWYPQLDIWLGTVDRCDLNDGDRFAPSRELWANYGIEWALKFAAHEVEKIPRCAMHSLE
ncbi:hypothetical protein EJ04DRAFT_510482 [Polyplosphaeria fusca]|uniref:CENP-V/GFA domain-containing protein n=1 Tax=Polyplosphaeria fusca TaxID=682080 RepID=A0A9P4R624_9PLEO|nr:hypothetical protein EJ04DRAFT_510482 [Polyplosphaeria fusca]